VTSESKIKELTATGAVTAKTSRLKNVVLTGGSDAATLVVRATDASGTIILSVKAAINTTVSVPLGSAHCSRGIHATLTGTGPTATFVYT
jgi:hypothetical protein